MRVFLYQLGLAATMLVSSAAAWGQSASSASRDTGDGTATAVWIFANVSFAGMRAQNSPSKGWRIVAFIFGFPGTLLSLLVIEQGSGRMYGIDLPRRESEVPNKIHP